MIEAYLQVIYIYELKFVFGEWMAHFQSRESSVGCKSIPNVTILFFVGAGRFENLVK